MASTYTVERAEKAETWKSANGEFQAWSLTLIDGQGSYEAQANTRLGNTFPGEGEKVDGELIPTAHGLKFKRAQGASAGNGGGSTFRPRDPGETKQIVHQHAQKAAIAFLQLRAYLKKIDDVELQDVFNVAARIREDVEKVR